MFEAAIERFGLLMEMCGFDKKKAQELLHEIDIGATHSQGFERDRFPRAMAQTYAQLCKETGKEKENWISGICLDIGNSPFFREPKLFANAVAVLGRAHHNFLIIAVTIGNREAQKYKIRQGGLQPLCDELIITPSDNKAERVREAIEDLNIDPALSAFIGNSRRSDGQCLTETNFIYLPLEKGWAFDESDLPPGSPYRSFEAKDWRDAEERAIMRLVRWRHSTPAPAK